MGAFHGGSGRNVIPAEAVLQAETRGADTAENKALETAARQVCLAAAKQYGCTCDITFMGAAGTAQCDRALADQVQQILQSTDGVQEVLPSVKLNIGEDVTTIMRRVQEHGGTATEIVLGMPLPYPHHSSRFDVDEQLLELGARCLAELAF